jgi:hypothetical protein
MILSPKLKTEASLSVIDDAHHILASDSVRVNITNHEDTDTIFAAAYHLFL